MVIPDLGPDATREDCVRFWMDLFDETRAEAEKSTQLYIDLGLFSPADEPDAKPAVTPEELAAMWL